METRALNIRWRGVLRVYARRPRYGYSHGIVRAFLLPGPTIARLSGVPEARRQGGRATIKRLRFRRQNRQGRVGTSRQMHPSLHKLAVSFTCRPLENGTSRHGEHESEHSCDLSWRCAAYNTDNADFRNAVGKGGRERWIDRRILVEDPHHAGLRAFRNGNARKKKKKK